MTAMTQTKMMTRLLVGLLGTMTLLALNAHEASAAGFALVEQSAVAGATGGAGVARSTDPAAAWYNPAALADGGGLRAAAGILIAVPQLSARALDGRWDEQTVGGPSTPPHVYLSYAHGPFAAGLAFNVPFGSGVTWPDKWEGRYEIVSSSLQVFRLSPFVAWRIGPVRVGAGMHVDLASLKIQRRLDFVDTDGTVDLSLNDVGFGGHASVFVDVARWLSLGASYKSRTSLALEGGARFEVPLAFSAKAYDQTVNADLMLPDMLSVGAEVRPHRKVKVVVDLGVSIWSVYEKLLVDFADDNTTDSEQVNHWETAVSVRGGVEYSVLPWLTARAGLFYDPSPVPAATLAPNSPDSNRFGVTTGLGSALPWGISVNAFYAYVHFLGQESANTENLHASYDGSLHMFGLGLSYSR
jgi:long-chain fatty acid transport protein